MDFFSLAIKYGETKALCKYTEFFDLIMDLKRFRKNGRILEQQTTP